MVDYVHEQATEADALTFNILNMLNQSEPGDSVAIMAALGGTLAAVALTTVDPIAALGAITKVAMNIIVRNRPDLELVKHH